jgi:hypothetical protein
MGYKKNTAQLVGQYDPDVIRGEDLDLTLKLAKLGDIRYLSNAHVMTSDDDYRLSK